MGFPYTTCGNKIMDRKFSENAFDLYINVATIIGMVIGIVLGCYWPMPQQPKASAPITNKLVKVKVLEECQKEDHSPWWLLETEDGQRCYVEYYVGKPNDKFALWSNKLQGYRLQPSDQEPKITPPIILPPRPVVAEVAKQEPPKVIKAKQPKLSGHIDFVKIMHDALLAQVEASLDKKN